MNEILKSFILISVMVKILKSYSVVHFVKKLMILNTSFFLNKTVRNSVQILAYARRFRFLILVLILNF